MKPWAKLWRYESREFKKLPARARMLAAYLIKVVDDSKRLPLGGRDAVTAIARAVSTDTRDRRWLRGAVAALMSSGVLTVDSLSDEIRLDIPQVTIEPGSRSQLPRLTVFTRDGWVCRYCRTAVDLQTGHVDHIIPRSRGGSDELENLTAACAPCNLSKGARTPEEWLS